MLLLALLWTCCVWWGDFRYTVKFVCGSASTCLICQSSQTIFETELAHTWEEFGHQQTNSPEYQASLEDHLCQYLLGDLWVLVALEVQGVQLVLGPPKPAEKNHHQKFAFKAPTTLKDIVSQKERKISWKELPWARHWHPSPLMAKTTLCLEDQWAVPVPWNQPQSRRLAFYTACPTTGHALKFGVALQYFTHPLFQSE